MNGPQISRTGSAALDAKAIQRQKQLEQLAKLQRREMRQVATQRTFSEWCESGFNPIAISRNFKTLEKLKEKMREKEIAKEKEKLQEKVIKEAEKAEETASNFQKNNPELLKQTLLILRSHISEKDSIDNILRKVLSVYPDYTLADEALDYLIATSRGDLANKLIQAKEYLNAHYQREIIAGKNIHVQARQFSEEGLGNPTALRDLYRDITGNPRTPHVLFNELTTHFNYDRMKTVIAFLLHSLGADLKAKGSSISRTELLNLIEDTKMLQAILGVYRFFKSRMNLVSYQFDHHQLILPPNLSFELLAKQFMALISERYISTDKILQLSRKLGIGEEIIAQIIILSQMRDAIRQTAPLLYKSNRKRQEILLALIEAIEELEEEEEEEE